MEINLGILIVLLFIALKSLVIGSDFNFIAWIKDKKKYIDWYSSRETYSEFKNKK